MKKKILVLGAYGFIGSRLVRSFSEKGYLVYGIGRFSQNSIETPARGSFIECDIDEESILKLCPDPDVIVNCAGGASVPASFNEPYQDFKKTSTSLFAGLEVIRKFSPKCLFIQTSSSAVYGNQQGKLSENASTQTQISPYGVYKKICEQICDMYFLQFGVNISILRLFSVYGPGLKKQLLWDACNKIKGGNNLFFGTGKEIRDWVHIDDVCGLYNKVIELNQTGRLLINGGSGFGFEVNQVLNMIYQGLGIREAPLFSQNQRLGDPEVFIADNELARSLGWRATISLDKGIIDYTNWFKSCV